MIINEIRKRIIKWEEKNGVLYPWRVNRTPYKVLIAEFLLKRTTRQAVSREFLKFIRKFPNINSIYNAPIEEIEDALKHLGLYKQRAKQLKQLAEIIVEKYGGNIPDNWEDLISLPGVGIYLAGAILSFGYGKKAPVLDSNVIRLLSRLTNLEVKKHKNYLKLLWTLVPDEKHDYFNYGLIDLGALICHYRLPRCNKCPLKEFCVYYLKNTHKSNDTIAKCFEKIYKELSDIFDR